MARPHAGTPAERQGLRTNSEQDEEGMQVLKHHLQPPPLTHLRAEAVDRMLSEPLTTVVPRAPPPSSFIIFRYVICNGLFSGSPFPITSSPHFLSSKAVS